MANTDYRSNDSVKKYPSISTAAESNQNQVSQKCLSTSKAKTQHSANQSKTNACVREVSFKH